MKKSVILALLVASGTSGCMEATNDTALEAKPAGIVTTTNTQNGTLDGGKFDYVVDEFPNRVTAFITPKALKDCTTDFTGVCEQQSFARLVVSCEKDGVSDAVGCYMRVDPQEKVTRNVRDTKNGFNYNPAGGIVFYTNASGTLRNLCVVGHDFPGQRANVRVDNNSAYTTNDKGCISGPAVKKIFSQAVSGSIILTRRVEWPYQQPKDRFAKVDDILKNGLNLLNRLRSEGLGPL